MVKRERGKEIWKIEWKRERDGKLERERGRKER